MKQPSSSILLTILLVSTILHSKNFTNSIGIRFVEIQGGSFMMGTAINSLNCQKNNLSVDKLSNCVKQNNYIHINETPRHKVKVRNFYMATTKITQMQYYSIMKERPSFFTKEKLGYDGKNNPVEYISYYDAQEFILKLNKKENTNKYRLPTEEEWEYSARAGSKTKWHFGKIESNLKDYAWYSKNSGNKTHPVGKKKPNKFKLYDMYGNVYEWTSSCYTKTYTENCDKNRKVLRGGSWLNIARYVSNTVRYDVKPDSHYYNNGFRIAKTK